jgi:hypothetical protein
MTEDTAQVAQIGERGRLVDDCFRPPDDHRSHDHVPVKQVEVERLGPKHLAPPGDPCVPNTSCRRSIR